MCFLRLASASGFFRLLSAFCCVGFCVESILALDVGLCLTGCFLFDLLLMSSPSTEVHKLLSDLVAAL